MLVLLVVSLLSWYVSHPCTVACLLSCYVRHPGSLSLVLLSWFQIHEHSVILHARIRQKKERHIEVIQFTFTLRHLETWAVFYFGSTVWNYNTLCKAERRREFWHQIESANHAKQANPRYFIMLYGLRLCYAAWRAGTTLWSAKPSAG
jgi:O-antigen/teichoic acid export membrane protein